MSSGLGRSTLVMTAGTLVSRVLGFVRTALLAGTIAATGLSANSFDLANKIPSILQMLIAGGVLNAVLVPQVVRAYQRARDDPQSLTDGTSGDVFVSRLLTIGGAILLGLTVVFTAGSGLLVGAYSGGGPELTALATAFAFWCMPQVFFYGVYTLLGQVLNARKSFGPYMWAPVVNNVVAILGLGAFLVLFGRPDAGAGAEWWDGGKIAVLAGTATLGVIGQAVVLVPFLRRLGFRFRLVWGVRGVGLGTAGRVAGWTFAALLVGQGAYLLATNVMTAAEKASAPGASAIAGNAAYSIAFMVSMLPHSLVTVSLVTALFTGLARHAGAGRTDAVRADLSHGLRLLAVFTSFASVGLAVLALPLARVMLPGNGVDEVRAVAGVVVALLGGLVALGAWALCQRVYYAYEDARGLFWIQVPMAVVVAGGAFLAQGLLDAPWWVVGVSAAMSLSNWLGALVALGRLRGRLDGIDGPRVLRLHVRTGLAALGAGGLGWAVLHQVGGLDDLGWWVALGLCVGVGTLMAAAYLGLLALMRVRELGVLLGPVRSRLGRGRPPGPPDAAAGTETAGTASAEPTALEGAAYDDVAGTGEDAVGGFDMVDGDLGRGSVLAGRYRLDEPLPTDLPGTSAWAATDQILDRRLRVVLLHAGHLGHALDAARRAALVSDPRLVRVLDVLDLAEEAGGPSALDGAPTATVGVLVTEAVDGVTLAELVRTNGPLPASQARALVGEIAQALEVARRRGVHHLALRPGAVHVDPTSGAVLVTGLGVDAALLGQGIGDARSTTRADTVAAVQLLYAALTGTWPGVDIGLPAGHPDALPRAATVGPAHVPVPPGDVVAGVPNDLDTLCAVTLGEHDDGPQSPAELAAELEPWDVVRGWDLSHRAPAPAPAPAPTGPPSRQSVLRAHAADTGPQGAVTQSVPGPPPAQPSPPAPAGPPTRQSLHSVFAQPSAGTDLPGTPPPAIPVRASVRPGHNPPPAAPVTPPLVVPAPAMPPAAVAPEAAPRPVIAPPPAAFPPPRAAAQVRSAAPVPPASPASAARPPHARPTGARPMTDQLGFDDIVTEEGLTTKRFDPTKLILAVVGVAVVIGLFIALRGIFAPIDPAPPAADRTPAASTSPSATPSESVSPSTSPTPSDTPTGPAPVIASGKQLDPQGDENEHPEAEGKAVDGDMSTYWFTRTYRDPSYGMKKGVGYAVTLEGSAVVSSVTLHTGGEGGRVEVRATDPSTPTDGPVLAEGPMSPETVLTFTAPTEAESIVLWFTKLPVNAEGKNRLEVYEIEVG